MKTKKTSLVVALIYAIVTLISVLHHEIWSDEAQVWMLTKYISLPELFPHLVNEGHPPFFYLIVMPFAKLFNNIIWMQLICWFSSVLAIFLLWNNSKFSSLTKTVITLSAPFIYFFPTIARSYSIIPLLVFLLAIFHNKTKEHPFIYSFLLIALTHTHVIMAMLTFVLYIRFLYLNIYIPYKNKEKQNKHFIISAILIFLAFFGLLIQLIGTTSSNVYINFKDDDKVAALARIIFAFIFGSMDAYYIKSHATYFNPFTISYCLIFALTFISMFIGLYKNNKKLFLICTVSSLFQILIYLTAYNQLVLPTRIFSMYAIIIFAFWVLFDENNFRENSFFTKKKNIAAVFTLFFALMILNGIKSYYADIVFDYSGSKKMAQFIKNNYADKNPIIFTDATNIMVAINYYLDPKHNLYWVKTGKPYKYVIWLKDIIPSFREENWEFYLQNVRLVDKKSPLFVIVCYDAFWDKNRNLEWKNFDLVYVTGDSLEYFEKFRLYKYKY